MTIKEFKAQGYFITCQYTVTKTEEDEIRLDDDLPQDESLLLHDPATKMVIDRQHHGENEYSIWQQVTDEKLGYSDNCIVEHLSYAELKDYIAKM